MLCVPIGVLKPNMSKAILVFDLPEEDCNFKIASTAMDWATALQDVDNEVRNWLKYEHSFRTPEEALEKVREFIREALAENNISFEMLN